MEKYADEMPRLMQRREENFETLFRYSSPNFITPSTPDYKNIEDRHREAANIQVSIPVRVFVNVFFLHPCLSSSLPELFPISPGGQVWGCYII